VVSLSSRSVIVSFSFCSMHTDSIQRYVYVSPDPDKFLRHAIRKHAMKGSMFKRYGSSVQAVEGQEIQAPPPKPKGPPIPTPDEIMEKLNKLKMEKRRIFGLVALNTKKQRKTKEVVQPVQEPKEKTFMQPRTASHYQQRPAPISAREESIPHYSGNRDYRDRGGRGRPTGLHPIRPSMKHYYR
jgi:hypothetical protein